MFGLVAARLNEQTMSIFVPPVVLVSRSVAVIGEAPSSSVIATAGPGGGAAGGPSRVQAKTPTPIRTTSTAVAAELNRRTRKALFFWRRREAGGEPCEPAKEGPTEATEGAVRLGS